jgi:hypothetical protein
MYTFGVWGDAKERGERARRIREEKRIVDGG